MTESPSETQHDDTPLPQSRFFCIDTNGKLSTISSLQEGLNAVKSGGYFWLDYCDPNLEILQPLISELNIHPLTIEDILHVEQLPKLDLFSNYSFMIFNIFENTDSEIQTNELDLIIGSNFVISSARRDQAGRPFLMGFERIAERESQRIKNGPSFLLHLIVDTVTDRKLEVIDQIEGKLDLDEDEILADSRTFDLSRLMDSRRSLMTIRKSIFYEREVVSKLIRQDSPFISEQSIIFFRDVNDHLSRYYEISETARDQVTSLMEIHLSMINNRMSQTSNRTNAIMRRLTLITTIFMPLTLISGIGGMSEFTLLVGEENLKIGYIVLFVLMAIIALVNYSYLKRMEREFNEEE
ncbi:MAG: magnesium transporter CorA family protein [Anaerolineaceae bacterium]|jgi:magnesium transporter